MSAPSTSWAATAPSGVRRCQEPSYDERKVTPSSSSEQGNDITW